MHMRVLQYEQIKNHCIWLGFKYISISKTLGLILALFYCCLFLLYAKMWEAIILVMLFVSQRIMMLLHALDQSFILPHNKYKAPHCSSNKNRNTYCTFSNKRVGLEEISPFTCMYGRIM